MDDGDRSRHRVGTREKQQRSGSDDGHQVGNALTIEESRSDACHPEQSRRRLGSGPRFKRKRTLKLSMSTTSEEQPPGESRPPLLAIEDQPPNEGESIEKDTDDIEDTNSEPFKYAWDDINNKGKRIKPGGRWQTCKWQAKDRASGFMKCFWDTHSGEEESWLSEMTILEYEANEDIDGVKKKPAASVLKRPAAVMKKPATIVKKHLHPRVRKNEHSRVYHQTYDKAVAAGNNKEVAKQKAREAASKHIQVLISKL